MNLSQFMGHFHPVVVHLPIGILLLALCFEGLSRRERFQNLQASVSLMLLFGAFSALISCFTGYLLSQSGEYEGETLERHQWLGIGVAAFSFVLYFLKKRDNSLIINILSAGLFLGIAITGHLGGSLTHGSDYLFGSTPSVSKGSDASKTVNVANLAPDAVVFKDVVQPIFKEKCASCHGASKQKGKLRLDESDFIFKGGEDGLALVAGKADESNLIKRILLPLDHKEHMPPKEKNQITASELEIMKWWIANGADIHKTVKELPALQSDNMKPKWETPNYIPDVKVPEPSLEAIQALKKQNIVVVPIGANQNLLSVSFINQTDISAAKPHLQELSKNIIWLKFSGIKLGDSTLTFLSNFDNLTKLFVDKTDISDAALKSILGLKSLVFLNLVGTKVTNQGILSLKSLSKLKKLFIYETGVKSEEFTNLQAQLSSVEIDTGGYKVSTLTTDTVRLSPPMVKK